MTLSCLKKPLHNNLGTEQWSCNKQWQQRQINHSYLGSQKLGHLQTIISMATEANFKLISNSRASAFSFPFLEPTVISNNPQRLIKISKIKLRKVQRTKTVIALQKMCSASLIDKVREIVFLRTIVNYKAFLLQKREKHNDFPRTKAKK